MKDLISGYKIKEDLTKWQLLHQHIPIIYDIMEQCSTSHIIEEMMPLLHDLLEISLYPFVNLSQDNYADTQMQDNEMSFCPSLRTCRARGIYSLDSSRSKPACGKRYKGHPSLLPRVSTLFCPHGK
jgi:hypothetical protein